MSIENTNQKNVSVCRLIDLACSGTLSEGQLKDLIHTVGGLKPADRTDFWIAVRHELDPGLYTQLHNHYVRYTLSHRWSK